MRGLEPYQHKKTPPPTGLSDVPRYLRDILGGFFGRFGYIVTLVWRTGKWILFLLTFVALFRGVSPVIGALISKGVLNGLQQVVTDGAAGDFFRSDVFYLLVWMFAYRIIVQVINEVTRALNRIAGELVVRQVKTQMMEKAKNLDLASFDDAAFYERMENATREASMRPMQILSETFGIVSTVIEFVSYLLILLAVPGLWWATLIIIAVSIPSAIINFIYRRKNWNYMRRRSKDRRQMDYYSGLLTNKDMVKEIRLFDLADVFIGRYAEVFRNYFRGLRKLILSESAWHVAIGMVSGVTNLVFYILIARQVFTGDIMLGDYTLYTGAIASVANCVSMLISSSGTIYEGTLFIDNLITFMEEPITIAPAAALTSPRRVQKGAGHTIVFDHVSFRYPKMDRDVISDVTFTINPGETLALVGLNGAGKTTLIKLLTRLYDPTAGRILLDGYDLREYDLGDLYGSFGIIFQDFGKYAVSVEENIRFGDIHLRPSPATGAGAGYAGALQAMHPASQAEPDLRVVAAAQQASAADYIQRLPDGYNTHLMRIFEPTGAELSVGQWQKLAVARAFYADSEILVLDEPTASLDAIAEQEIFSQFDRLRGEGQAQKTTIFVSHRLSSATIASQVIVLENGRLIEHGTHKELMALGGKYAELFNTQAQRYLS